MLYFFLVPFIVGIVIAFFIGKPERWRLFFSFGAILLILSRLTLNFQHKSNPLAPVDSLMDISGPIMAVGSFLLGIANVLGYKFSKAHKK